MNAPATLAAAIELYKPDLAAAHAERARPTNGSFIKHEQHMNNPSKGARQWRTTHDLSFRDI